MPQRLHILSTAADSNRLIQPTILTIVQNDIALCTRCPSMKPWRQFAPSAYGNPLTGYLLVGEAPGYVSWKQHRRFTGPAGMLIRRALRQVGHHRYRDLEDLFYITDVVKCHPASELNPASNRSPKSAEVNACSEYLIKELDALRPSLIVAFGKHASENVSKAIAACRNPNGKTTTPAERVPSIQPEVIVFPHPSPRNQLSIRKRYPSLQAFQEDLTKTFADLIQRLESIDYA